MDDDMAIVRPETPQLVTQSEDEIAVSVSTRKFIFYRLISQSSKETILDTAKKRKHTSLLK
jgi:hypothetical protein